MDFLESNIILYHAIYLALILFARLGQFSILLRRRIWEILAIQLDRNLHNHLGCLISNYFVRRDFYAINAG